MEEGSEWWWRKSVLFLGFQPFRQNWLEIAKCNIFSLQAGMVFRATTKNVDKTAQKDVPPLILVPVIRGGQVPKLR